MGNFSNFAVRGIKWPGRANIVVSLVAMHKGPWTNVRMLDGQEVSFISAYLDDSLVDNEPKALKENVDRVFEGSKFLGDGFLLSHEEADRLIQADNRNRKVIFPVINGQELNNNPNQTPGRSIINFFDWKLEKAKNYKEVFARIELLVKPVREKDNRAIYRERWWQYAEPRKKLTAILKQISICFIASATTKHLSFSAAPTNYVFTQALKVFTTDRWDLFTVVQSTLHEVWARKYSGFMKQDLRYSPSKCFDTFPFPDGLWQTTDPHLATLGEHYHEHRRALMQTLQLGLTNIYNLFHTEELTPEQVAKVSKQPPDLAQAGYQGILDLRRLHRDLDNAVRDAYGWSDLDLGHAFVDVETLPENDRRRYTLSPAARKELLRRLLALNLQRTSDATAAASDKKPAPKKSTRKSKPTDDRQMSLFNS